MTDVSRTLERNLAEIRQEIAAACLRRHRDPSAVRIVAVTKYAAWSAVQTLSGLHHMFGENRPQQLAERQTQLPQIEWHLIGQLQRNKVRLALSHAAVIHSVDSMKLLQRIVETSRELGIRPRLLLQVNVSGEQSKSGFSVVDLNSRWNSIAALSEAVSLEGLMTMAPEDDDPEFARATFSGLSQLRDALRERPESQLRGLSLPELSMGMSGDFVPAVEEGATLVRIGSRIFEGTDPD